jgi:hypothetical protein
MKEHTSPDQEMVWRMGVLAYDEETFSGTMKVGSS